MDKSTPRPWVLKDHGKGALWIEDEVGTAIASLPDWLPEVGNPRAANATLIIKAVNRDHVFNVLIEALREIVELDHHRHAPESQATKFARAALAAAEVR